MTETYNTIISEGQDEIIEKKSRFIGYAVPVSTEEEAYAFVEKVKKQHFQSQNHRFQVRTASKTIRNICQDL